MSVVCARHPDCPYVAEIQRAFDAWVAAEKEFCRGNVSSRQIRELQAAYHAARDERARACEGVVVP